jgi:hypothetical protein
MHAESHAVISQVGFALLPAFVSFKAEMYPRLLLFFEGIIRGMLHEEMRLRGLANVYTGGLSGQGTYGILIPPDLFHSTNLRRALRRDPGR